MLQFGPGHQVVMKEDWVYSDPLSNLRVAICQCGWSEKVTSREATSIGPSGLTGLIARFSESHARFIRYNDWEKVKREWVRNHKRVLRRLGRVVLNAPSPSTGSRIAQ